MCDVIGALWLSMKQQQLPALWDMKSCSKATCRMARVVCPEFCDESGNLLDLFLYMLVEHTNSVARLPFLISQIWLFEWYRFNCNLFFFTTAAHYHVHIGCLIALWTGLTWQLQIEALWVRRLSKVVHHPKSRIRIFNAKFGCAWDGLLIL